MHLFITFCHFPKNLVSSETKRVTGIHKSYKLKDDMHIYFPFSDTSLQEITYGQKAVSPGNCDIMKRIFNFLPKKRYFSFDTVLQERKLVQFVRLNENCQINHFTKNSVNILYKLKFIKFSP